VGFKPTHGIVPMDGCFPLAPSFDTAGPMAKDVAMCIQIMDHFDVEPRYVESLEEVEVAVSWLEHAEPLVRERVETAAARFPRRKHVEFPEPKRFSPAFQREVADVHRELFAEHRGLYGSNVRTKIERCLAVTDDEVDASRAAREAYREGAPEVLGDADLLLTPTLRFVAPPVGLGDLAIREDVIRFTKPFNSLGWPALALPCGPAEEGLPASLQIAGRPGDDALVLAAGSAIEAALRPRPRG
jgi:Asp-tRNA(Asn)/Glu-tRNA(Gln) amidotransferase A subunit family amidase